MQQSLQMQSQMHGEGSMEEVKRMLAETSPWLLAVTALVSVLHTLFDVLAFKNDIAFWRNTRTRTRSLPTPIPDPIPIPGPIPNPISNPIPTPIPNPDPIPNAIRNPSPNPIPNPSPSPSPNPNQEQQEHARPLAQLDAAQPLLPGEG